MHITLAHILSLRWRHNGHGSVSNHQPHDCLLNRLFRRRSKKTSKLRVTGLCAGNSPVIPRTMASNAENVSIWWRHHVQKRWRLRHSPSLVAIGLSVGYKTWPPIGWHHAFVIGWPKYIYLLPSAPLHYGLAWPVGIPTICQTPVTVPLYSSNGRQMPVVRAVQVECEVV